MQKSEGSTESERYLAKLCRRSFLELWSYPNPYRDQGKQGTGDGKELCDLLVVCGDDVIIFSDKSCEFRETERPEIDWKRWYKRAVVRSARQVRGAERWIREHPDRIFLDRACQDRLPIGLPDPATMRIHRIVVALGAKAACQKCLGGAGSLMINTLVSDGFSGSLDGLMPFTVGALGRGEGYIHHFDDVSLDVVMGELDTITDFVRYLEKKEALLCSEKHVAAAGEEELLARYLVHMEDDDRHGFAIPDELDLVVFDEGEWLSFQSELDYIRKKEADEPSFLWDSIIEEFTRHVLKGTLIEGSDDSLRATEEALRIMAKEPRVVRRVLSASIVDFLSRATPGKIAFRRVCGPEAPEESELVYVCCLFPEGDDALKARSNRRAWLEGYCFALAEKHRTHKTVVGIATENSRGPSHSWDLCLVQIPSWTDEMKLKARAIRKRLGILDEGRATRTHVHASEYPSEADAKKADFGLFGRSGKQPKKKKVGRNDPCPCGSGLKFKKCCLKKRRWQG